MVIPGSDIVIPGSDIVIPGSDPDSRITPPLVVSYNWLMPETQPLSPHKFFRLYPIPEPSPPLLRHSPAPTGESPTKNWNNGKNTPRMPSNRL